MSWIQPPGLRTGFAGRLQLAGLLIATGIVVELGTLFWNHPVSLFLFLTLGAGLVVAGMVLYLWSVVTRSERGHLESVDSGHPIRRSDQT